MAGCGGQLGAWCLTLAKWETVSGQFGGYLNRDEQTLSFRTYLLLISEGLMDQLILRLVLAPFLSAIDIDCPKNRTHCYRQSGA